MSALFLPIKQDKEAALFIGQPALHSDMANHREGYIVELNDADKVTIAWAEESVQTLPRSIAQRFVDKAKRYGLAVISEEQARLIREQAQAATDKRCAQARAEQSRKAEAQAQFEREAAEKLPAHAKAVIVATLRENESDSQTDYFAQKTQHTVILAWSTHTRDLFNEMRKAAKTDPRTAHLATDGVEHREKYSMGKGFYLSSSDLTYTTGWEISKVPLCYRKDEPAKVDRIPVGEWGPAL